MKRKAKIYFRILLLLILMITVFVACEKQEVEPVKSFDSNILNQYGRKLTEAFVPNIDIDKKAYFQVELYVKEGAGKDEKKFLISGYEDYLNKKINILIKSETEEFLYYDGESVYSLTNNDGVIKKYKYGSISYAKFIENLSLIPSRWLHGFNVEDYNHENVTYNGRDKKSRYDFREIYLNTINQLLFAAPGVLQIPGFAKSNDFYGNIFSGESYYDEKKNEIYLKGKGFEIKELNLFEFNVLPLGKIKEKGFKMVSTEHKFNSEGLHIKFFAERKDKNQQEKELYELRIPQLHNMFSENVIEYAVPELMGFEDKLVIDKHKAYEIEVKKKDGTKENLKLNASLQSNIDPITDLFKRTIIKKKGSIIKQNPTIEADVYNLETNRDDIKFRVQIKNSANIVLAEMVYDQMKYGRNYIYIFVEKETLIKVLKEKEANVDYDVLIVEEELIEHLGNKYVAINIDLNVFVKTFPRIDISNELIGAIIGLDFNGAISTLPTYLEKIELWQRVIKNENGTIIFNHNEFIKLVDKYKLEHGLIRIFKYYPAETVTISEMENIDFAETNFDKNQLLKEITKIDNLDVIDNCVNIDEDINEFLEKITKNENHVVSYSYKNKDDVEKEGETFVTGYKNIDENYAFVYLCSVGSKILHKINTLIYKDLIGIEQVKNDIPNEILIKVKKVI